MSRVRLSLRAVQAVSGAVLLLGAMGCSGAGDASEDPSGSTTDALKPDFQEWTEAGDVPTDDVNPCNGEHVSGLTHYDDQVQFTIFPSGKTLFKEQLQNSGALTGESTGDSYAISGGSQWHLNESDEAYPPRSFLVHGRSFMDAPGKDHDYYRDETVRIVSDANDNVRIFRMEQKYTCGHP